MTQHVRAYAVINNMKSLLIYILLFAPFLSKAQTYTEQPPFQSLEIELHTYWNQMALTINSRQALDQLAEVLLQDANASSELIIETHTSSYNFAEDRKESKTESKTRSEAKAALVKDYLLGKNVPTERLTIRALGRSQPKPILDQQDEPVYVEPGDSQLYHLRNERIILYLNSPSQENLPQIAQKLKSQGLDVRGVK